MICSWTWARVVFTGPRASAVMPDHLSLSGVSDKISFDGKDNEGQRTL